MATKKKNKNTTNIIIAVVLIVVVFFVYRKMNPKPSGSGFLPTPSNTPSSGSTNASSQYTQSTHAGNTVLKRGQESNMIKSAQEKINTIRTTLGITKLIEDGKFGPLTEKAFKKLLGKNEGSYNEVVFKVNSLTGPSLAGSALGPYSYNPTPW